MASEEFAAQLKRRWRATSARPAPFTISSRLTGGANKTTWSFDADVGADAAGILILQMPGAVGRMSRIPSRG